MYQLKYQGAFAVPEQEDVCVLTLTDANEQRALSLVTTPRMALDIKRIEHHEKPTDHLVVEALIGIIKENGLFHHYIKIDGRKDEGLVAFLVDATTGAEKEVLPDEAVLLAIAAGLAMEATLDAIRYFSTPFNANVMQVALPILSLPDKLLRKALDKAVEEENYESASFIRDEINRRKERRQNELGSLS